MNRLLRRCGLILATVAAVGCDSTTGPETYDVEVMLPAHYNDQTYRTWPTLIFLHGAGGLDEHLDDLDFAKSQDPDFPFIVILPRAGKNGMTSTSVRRTLEEVMPQYRIDADHTYITGLSAGAYVAWRVASYWNDRFAAIVLVAGGGLDELACSVKHIPVWLVHNRNDAVVPASESIELAEAIEACGGQVTLTLLDAPPGPLMHNAWTQLYRGRAFWDWLLSHERPAAD